MLGREEPRQRRPQVAHGLPGAQRLPRIASGGRAHVGHPAPVEDRTEHPELAAGAVQWWPVLDARRLLERLEPRRHAVAGGQLPERHAELHRYPPQPDQGLIGPPRLANTSNRGASPTAGVGGAFLRRAESYEHHIATTGGPGEAGLPVAANSERGASLARRVVRRSGVDRPEGPETLPQDEPAERIIVLDEAAPARAALRRSQHRLLYCRMAFTDVLGMLAALLLALQIRFGWHWPAGDFVLVLGAAAVVTLAVYHGFGLYQTHQFSTLEEFRRMITAVTLAVTAVAMLSFWSQVSYSRLWVVCSWILALVFATVSRRLWHRQIRHSWNEGKLTFDTLIIGTNDEASTWRSCSAAIASASGRSASSPPGRPTAHRPPHPSWDRSTGCGGWSTAPARGACSWPPRP